MYPAITVDNVRLILRTIKKGLIRGLGIAQPGRMCVEAAVCYGLGLDHSDNPICVTKSLRNLKIALNDSEWSSNEARAEGLRRLAIAQLGSRVEIMHLSGRHFKNAIDDHEFSQRVIRLAIQSFMPPALRISPIQPNIRHNIQSLKEQCEQLAVWCETHSSPVTNFDLVSRFAMEFLGNPAFQVAHNLSANIRYPSELHRCSTAASNLVDPIHPMWETGRQPKADKTFADFAEGVVQILIDMKAPGTQWLYLTEEGIEPNEAEDR